MQVVRHHKMPVELPLSGRKMVDSIASPMDHLGNRIAEGEMHPSMFWPTLARLHRLKAERLQKQLLAKREKQEKQAYAEEWVDRWLDFMAKDQKSQFATL